MCWEAALKKDRRLNFNIGRFAPLRNTAKSRKPFPRNPATVAEVVRLWNTIPSGKPFSVLREHRAADIEFDAFRMAEHDLKGNRR
jgi:hypothetical protein